MTIYKIELVTKESPYINLGYVKNTSIHNDILEFTHDKEDALTIGDKSTLQKVVELIRTHNKQYVRVMPWITEYNGNKRIFENKITWEQ